MTLKKSQAGEHFPDLERLPAQILPAGAEDVLARASRGAAQGGAAADDDDEGMKGLASEMLKRALGSENQSRAQKRQPELVMSVDDDDNAEPDASAMHSGPSAYVEADNLERPQQRFGYGFGSRQDRALNSEAVERSRSYLLRESEPSSIDLKERRRRAWQNEEDGFDPEWYMWVKCCGRLLFEGSLY